VCGTVTLWRHRLCLQTPPSNETIDVFYIKKNLPGRGLTKVKKHWHGPRRPTEQLSTLRALCVCWIASQRAELNKHCSSDLRQNSETCQMKSVHQVPYHKRVCSFSVFVLKWSSCVQNPVNTLSSPWFPKYSCWALHSVSNNLCGRCLRGVPIYICQRFPNCIPGNQGVGKKIGWGSKTGYNAREQSLLHITGIDPESSDVQSTPKSLRTYINLLEPKFYV